MTCIAAVWSSRRVPVWNMPTLAINQCTDDIAQGCKGQVDLDALLEPVSYTSGQKAARWLAAI
jgi:hypothetical protein